MADIDIESEKYRWMGSARLDFYVCPEIFPYFLSSMTSIALMIIWNFPLLYHIMFLTIVECQKQAQTYMPYM